ncbi:MAG: hypothetical protein J7527_16515, partial [Chitinophagaceae bacterium]|nr:hypothetical protein [Chitinophagaceae bacterium]
MNNQYKLVACLFAILFIVGSCRKETVEQIEDAPVLTGLDADYYVLVRESITIKPVIQNRVDSIEWVLDG